MNRINIWIALLLASVLLNGLLIGASAHRWLHDDGPSREAIRADAADAASVKGFEPRSFFRAVPEEYRRDLFEHMAGSRDEVYGLMRDLGDKRRAVRDVLTSEPYDPEAAAEALSEARDARARLEQRTEALILDAAGILPADVRRDAFDRALTRHHDRDHDRRGGDRGSRHDGERGDDDAHDRRDHAPRHEPPAGPNEPDLF
ncbi:periplasmic heavy metal sensor [Oceanicaulis sp. LC35]|uniref:periplasmic heavy metal sensor n=1 Tax=Oceanicaulis sp. LC35 TaxID=3349635 RepID=UPI003F85059E